MATGGQDQKPLFVSPGLYLNEHRADVHFICTNEDGSTSRLPAHKFVLSLASDTFYTQFFGSLPEGTNEIQIMDELVTTAAFKLLLKYLYCGTVELDREQVPKVLYLAKRYLMEPLEDKCKAFMMAQLHEYSDWCLELLQYLYAALGERESTLMEMVLQSIEENGNAAVTSELFCELSAEVVSLIVHRDALNVDELTLFKMVVNWSEKECECNELPMTLDNKRAVLQGILPYIRFTAVSLEEFREMMAVCRILPDDLILHTLLTEDKSTLPFNSNPRQPNIKKLYIMGGHVNGTKMGGHMQGGSSELVRIYHLDRGCHVTAMPMNEQRAWHCAAYCHATKQILVIGAHAGNAQLSAEKCTLDVDGPMFTTMPMKQHRSGASCVCIGTKLYVMGGHGTQSCECYDVELDTWTDIASLPHTVNRACCVVYEDGDKKTILLIGGWNIDTSGKTRKALETVLEYDPVQNQWTERKDMQLPTKLHNSAAVYWNGSVVVVGGGKSFGSKGAANECYSLDRENKKWVSMPNMNTRRFCHAAVVLGGKIVVMGGRDEHDNLLKSVEVFDGEQWTHAHELDATIYSFTALVA